MSDKKSILYLLDADPFPSPFDINVAYDSGYDVVVPIGGISEDNIKQLVEDAMFSRGMKGASYTKLFINGSNHAQIKKIVKIARKSMVPPFELTMMIDPRGGYTTGASIVAQVESDLELIGKKELKECKVVVFGGTGMVGQTVSVLCSKAGAETTLCSRSQERAENICNEINTSYNANCIPKAQGNEEERVALCMDKDLIFTCGTAGVQIITIEMLKKLPGQKICADANAVPPLGIEGIDPSWKAVESEELERQIFFYGALSIGDVKLKVEKLALQEMMEASGFDKFSFMEFYDYAKEIIIRKKNKKKKI